MCDYKSFNKKTLKEHTKSKHGGESIEYTLCPYKTAVKKSLKNTYMKCSGYQVCI